ncbi:FAD-binding protein [Nonomuraea sp. KC401]|uniref:FAD-binding protein n=1 Tax=unclassified Nonomuraea TaxID=2593643 RepID=UPI0010FDDB51|nr:MULTISPECIES: FAD-binding protein [unclassified Nonomuraea]NBE98591.1 FAD-binding protein [Nonomuraea sp. K271]TLF60557.1 FAD-binding protein [Nonomuraea sp. KC401]
MSTQSVQSVQSIARLLEGALPSGSVHTSGPGYDGACRLWNGAVDRRPAAVVTCHTTPEVAAAVQVARDLGVPLSVRGGGHGWSGAALADGGVVVDLCGLRDVTVDPRTDVAEVGGGASSLDVARAAGKHGLVVAAGTAGTVGFAGLVLGGGYGPLSGALGLAADNLLSADVVLADGTTVTASPDHEPELFWSLRGGGGNFGVVTGLRVRLHRVPGLLSGMMLYPLDAAPRGLATAARLALDCPGELTVQSGLITAPTGKRVMFVAPTWCGDPSEGEAVLARFAALGTPVFQQFGPAEQSELMAGIDAMFPSGRHVELRPRTLAELTPEAADLLVEGVAAARSPYSAVSLHALHGAAARVPAGATAYGMRSPHLVVENIAVWEPGDPAADAHRAWVRGLSDSLAPHALPGTYANLLGDDDPAQAEHAYGANAARLLRAKDHYDPGGAFRAIPLPPPADSRDMVAVHDMYRREFDRLRALLAAVPVDRTTSVRRVTDHGTFLIELLHAHHGSEDALVWPKLTARDPDGTRALTATMTAQHEAVDRRLRDTEESLAALAARPGEERRDDALNALDALIPPLREHLALEEAEALALIDRHLTAGEWAEVGGMGLAEVPPERVPVMFGMLLDGVSQEMYDVFAAAVPAEVLTAMAQAGPPAWAGYLAELRTAAGTAHA